MLNIGMRNIRGYLVGSLDPLKDTQKVFSSFESSTFSEPLFVLQSKQRNEISLGLIR